MYEISIIGSNLCKSRILKNQLQNCFPNNDNMFSVHILNDINQVTPDTNIFFCFNNKDYNCWTKIILEIKKISSSIYTIIVLDDLNDLVANEIMKADNYLIGEYNINDLKKNLFAAAYGIDSNRKFILHNKNTRHIIDIKRILYIESCNRNVKIYMIDRIINIASTLKFIGQKIKSLCFAKCHQSFIVNLNYIQSIYTNKLRLISGTEIPISRGYKDIFRNYSREYFNAGDNIDVFWGL